jgi:hypothetical protein
MRNPIERLTRKGVLAWLVTNLAGVMLAGYGPTPMLVLTGKLMMAMCLGYVLFGMMSERQQNGADAGSPS